MVRMYSAPHSDGPAKPIGNSASDPQAKPRPVLSLGGKERFEDASSVVGRNSAAAVGESDAKPIDGRGLPPISGLANA